MKKAAIASLLAASTFTAAPGMLPSGSFALAQAPAAASGSQIQMDPAEFTDYDNAVNKQTTPQTHAPALEAYLIKYPKSAVKADVLSRIMIDYSSFDHAKAIDAADKVLQLSPDNLQAYVIEVAYRSEAAQTQTDAAAKQSGLDASADYAQKGLAAAKPASTSDADYQKLKDYSTPIFYGAEATDDLAKKDAAGAITAYKAELAAEPPAATSQPAALQETYYLGQAYYQSTPPDYVNCTFYTTRAAALAPDQFKPQLQTLATYCYKKYHGSAEGYDAVVTAAKANLNPPADFTIKPAPTDADQVKTLMSSTKEEDLPKLALSDKEYIIQYGETADADRVFNTIKGKSVELPGVTVLAATADQLQVAVSDDAVQSKTADFTFSMKTPLKTVPTVGSKIDLSGTYASYTQKPLMITMSDGDVIAKKAAPAKKAPVRRTH